MEHLNFVISLVFGLITFLSVFTFYKASGDSRLFGGVAVGWILVQVILSLTGFFEKTEGFPRMTMVALLPLLLIATMLLTEKGRAFADHFDPQLLTVIHVLRGPVEMVIYWLFLCRLVPREMTFTGGNLDLLAGISAMVIYHWGVLKNRISWQILVTWNVAGLGLTVNMLVKCLLSAPSFYQTIALGQPNVAILRFPFLLLPGVVIPVILCAHLLQIRSLLKNNLKPAAFDLPQRLLKYTLIK